ncbi:MULTISPECIES: LppP/LprE family lipoprotein [unclassified Corynebacterium]|uniref:LppP/LprE family lipoprotein n=1 Tax=unclassified Corynebacterium TaxID=2624378 RepID=UPI00264B617B|nr:MULTISPECIES: LppP/LprE family lipoprotein [unclassified Corynebacterium]MDN8594900.1 LppP/LprE family lipoprotein [Corynebacterium sp. P4_F2]WKK56459.1 LppP/LprE family lipoprotein [Corynebacterium sp. P4-C1]WKK63893.1 LppP/LprE family lipoprotein [Corynebacterium sp. P8-C1]
MLNHRQYTRRFLAGLSFSCAVFLAGCSDDTIAEPPLQSVDSSVKATDGATSSTTITTLFETETETEAGQSEQEEPEKHEECDTDPASPEIHKAVDEANEEYPNKFGGWKFTGRTNFDSCADLSYAFVTQAEQGNAQFGTLILMFHKGEYIGVDSLYPQQAMEITPNDDGSFTVLYKDWEALDEAGAGNAESPNYNSTVTYYWDGDKVAHDGRIPNTSLTPQ